MGSNTTSSVDELARELSYFHERGANRLELVERTANDERVVEAWTTTSRVFDPRPIANDVQGRADLHARRGRSYAVQAYTANGEVAAFMGFVLVGTTTRAVDEARVADHTALERDVVSQAVRHNEVLLRGAAANVDGIIMHYQQALEDERRARREVEDKLRDALTQIQTHVGVNEAREERAHERTIELKKFETFGEPLKLLTPVVMSRLLHHKAEPNAPPSPIVGEALLRRVLRSLTSEQLRVIAGVLGEEQRLAFLELYKLYDGAAAAPNVVAATGATASPTDVVRRRPLSADKKLIDLFRQLTPQHLERLEAALGEKMYCTLVEICVEYSEHADEIYLADYANQPPKAATNGVQSAPAPHGNEATEKTP